MSAPDVCLGPFDLDRLEADVRSAIDRRQPERLELVGQGEFSLAMLLPPSLARGAGERVVKRIPPFRTRHQADEYCTLVASYIAALTDRGVRCVATETFVLDRDDGTAVVYHSQPRLDAAALVNNVIRSAPPDPGHPAVVAVIDAVVASASMPVAVDGQLANWFWHADEPWHLDFSTPLLLTADGGIRFDPWGFVREYPRVVAPLVKRELLRLAPCYTDPKFVLQDLTANLFREGLDHWAPATVRAIRERTGLDVTIDDSRAAFERDAKFFPTIQRFKRWQRAWIQGTGRRYDTLLPTTRNY